MFTLHTQTQKDILEVRGHFPCDQYDNVEMVKEN